MDIRNPRLDNYLDMPERGFTNIYLPDLEMGTLSSTKDMMILYFCLQVSFLKPGTIVDKTKLGCI
jgi:hypothetical protein